MRLVMTATVIVVVVVMIVIFHIVIRIVLMIASATAGRRLMVMMMFTHVWGMIDFLITDEGIYGGFFFRLFVIETVF